MKIAFTGTQGTGKTTSVFDLAKRLKIENPGKRVSVLTEAASDCPFPINRKTTPESQLWIFTTQLKRELDIQSRYDILVCDRTIIDGIAYTKVAGYDGLAKSMYEIAKHHAPSYSKIYFKTINNNDYHFLDGVRDDDTNFRKIVEDEMLSVYRSLLSDGVGFNFEVI